MGSNLFYVSSTSFMMMLSFSYFIERNHDKWSLVHKGVGNLKVGLIEMEVIEKQDVNIDGTVVVDARGESAASGMGFGFAE